MIVRVDTDGGDERLRELRDARARRRLDAREQAELDTLEVRARGREDGKVHLLEDGD